MRAEDLKQMKRELIGTWRQVLPTHSVLGLPPPPPPTDESEIMRDEQVCPGLSKRFAWLFVCFLFLNKLLF